MDKKDSDTKGGAGASEANKMYGRRLTEGGAHGKVHSKSMRLWPKLHRRIPLCK
jgi:hypothetical protein